MAGKRTKKTERKNANRRRRQNYDAAVRRSCDILLGNGFSKATENDSKPRFFRPVTEVPGRIKTAQEANALRRQFMVWDEGWRKRTERSERRGLNLLTPIDTWPVNGLQFPVYLIYGHASQVKQFPNGAYRLMLSAPYAYTSNGEPINIDDHIWLDVSKYLSPRDGKTLSIYYGDTMPILATLKAYGGDEHRLGVDWWTCPQKSQLAPGLYYIDTRSRKLRTVPNIYGDDALLLRITDVPGGCICHMPPNSQHDTYLEHLAHDFADVNATVYRQHSSAHR